MLDLQYHHTTGLKKNAARFRILSSLMLASVLIASALVLLKSVAAQAEATVKLPPQAAALFRVGEKLTYDITFGKFENAAYAELYVVSRGKLEGRDAFELRSKIKTNELVSAAYYMVDEARTTFASAETGLPLYVKKTVNAIVLPKETIYNYLNAPAATQDLLTLIYQIRNAGGSGSFLFQEDDKNYNLNLQLSGTEKLKTDAGDFETSVFLVQSQYLTEKGLLEFKVNLSADERRIPVLFRFKTAKGEFRAGLASVQTIEEKETESLPSPLSVLRPAATPTPVPTPTPYIENEPLLNELPFDLGETLDYQISTNNQTVGSFRLQAKERRQFLGQDSLLLTAVATGAGPGTRVFALNDGIRANVSPDTLAPQQIEIKFTGALSSFNQTTQFDQRTGTATSGGANRLEVPVGTHSLLSLAYAVRSFNLKPSKDPNNPVNDTRVAVFWDKQPYVFTLRPSTADIINLRGERVSAQLIAVNTGNPQLDQLNLRLWLSNDEKRLPLRLAVGSYQADLVSESSVRPQ